MFADFAVTGKLSESVVHITLKRLSEVAHVRQDDVVSVLDKIGFLHSKRPTFVEQHETAYQNGTRSLGQRDDQELVVSLDTILRGCERWKVHGRGILDETACLI